MSYPSFALTDFERDEGKWIAVKFGAQDPDDDLEGTHDVDGQVQVTVDPVLDTIAFAMEDREFIVSRQLLADTINELWPIEMRKVEEFVERYG